MWGRIAFIPARLSGRFLAGVWETADGTVTNEALSPRDIQAVQLLAGVAMAVFVGGRFLPPRYRQPIGLTLTVGYVTGIVIFAIYVFLR